jgi:cytoskeletal protein CcmA (bactofilin family)
MLLKIAGLAMKKGDEINAFLGKNTDFDGKLSFKGAVRVDGYFQGEIHSEGTLIVGEGAVLESDVYVSRIVVSGEVRGNIVASDRIEIHAPGKVLGNIQSPTVVIDEGVSFEGHCRMHPKGESDDRKLAVLRETWAENKET